MNCPRCYGRALLGGNLDGPYAGPWRWCSCPEALQRQESEPGLVDAANAARERLMRLMTDGKRLAHTTVKSEDLYNGEF